MKVRPLRGGTESLGLDGRRTRSDSYTRLAVTDAMLALGVVSVLSGVAGLADDAGDAVFLIVGGAAATALGSANRQALNRRRRPSPARVMSGLALTWLVLVALGAGVYLATGTIDRVDDALVEAAAGFGTTNVTTLDPATLTVPMQLWRAATQWVGGLVGLLAVVVAIPRALRGTALETGESHFAAERVAPNPITGRRRVAMIYGALTAAMWIAYLVVGMGVRDAPIHAMSTVSTGGFSSRPDSFASFGTGPQVVAIIGMIVAGSSYFLLWWLIRGQLRPAWRSTELRVYVGLLVAGALLIRIGAEEIGVTDAIFTAASALSTTGFASTQWTLAADSVLAVILLLIATGSMSGSAGGGLRVVRAWTLVGFASRELRAQLDPAAVVVIKQGGRAVDERTLERTTGYQIAHLGLCGIAAFFLASAGVDLLAAMFTGISVLSTFGPGIGTGSYGSLEDFSPVARLLLLPFMLAGRLTILPLLLGVASIFGAANTVSRRARRAKRVLRR